MPFVRPKPVIFFGPVNERRKHRKAVSEQQNQEAEEDPPEAGLGREGILTVSPLPAAGKAWRAAKVLGEGGRKPARGRGREDRGRAEKKKRAYNRHPRPITCIYFFSPLAHHLQALLQLGQQAAEFVLGRRGGDRHGIGTTVTNGYGPAG